MRGSWSGRVESICLDALRRDLLSLLRRANRAGDLGEPVAVTADELPGRVAEAEDEEIHEIE